MTATFQVTQPAMLGDGILAELATVVRGFWGDVGQPRAASGRAPVNHLVLAAETRVGAQLLAARDLDDLDDRLEAVVSDSILFHLNAVVWKDVDAQALAAPDSVEAAHHIERSLRALPAARRKQVAELVLHWLMAHLAALRHLQRHQGLDALRAQADAMSPALLTSPEVPVEIASAVFDQLCATACWLAVSAASRDAERLPPWLALGLTDRLAKGAQGHLCLLASMPGTAVPEALVPADNRVDLDAALRRHAASRRHVANLAAEFR